MKATTSETIVIGGVINRPDFILELSDLKAEFFTDRLNKIIFIAIKRLYKNGAKQIDIADIYALIESNQKYLKKNNALWCGPVFNQYFLYQL